MSRSEKQGFQNCDCVVMLTWSDWHREMRSNRYHYATRFARHLPVVFVQPDLPAPTWKYEETEFSNIHVLHLGMNYGPEQTTALNLALKKRGFLKPLFWIYNFLFIDAVQHIHAPLRIYHASEDYFSPDFLSIDRIDLLRQLLQMMDLVIAVSSGVADSYRTRGSYSGEFLILPNGCDFSFWNLQDDSSMRKEITVPAGPIAFYQGNINQRLDFQLIESVCQSLPHWTFWFCGEVVNQENEWNRLRQLPNLVDLGYQSPQILRQLSRLADVGVIPFIGNEMITERSLPLKAWEYAACGLPVVTIPIHALQNDPQVFHFATNSKEFAEQIDQFYQHPISKDQKAGIVEIASRHDYDRYFEQLTTRLNRDPFSVTTEADQQPLKLAILFDTNSVHVATLREHLESFRRHSSHQVWYLPATHRSVSRIDLDMFDVVIIHYSIRVSLANHLSVSMAEAIRSCGCYRVLFIQDEYDTTETSRQWINDLGIHAVFTCVPETYREVVYPSWRFPAVEFISTLSGYVPEVLAQPRKWRSRKERPWVIGYRGRCLPEWYGKLGHEKKIIGQRMKEICLKRGISVNIEWNDEQRIYGQAWYQFLESCQATLGTESGANLFDDWGHVRRQVEELRLKKPDIDWENLYNQHLEAYDDRIRMNQVSPKIFEAIALRTTLILFEGEYSNVLRPELDYLPLKKDFSNIDEILTRLTDQQEMEEMTHQAWERVVASGVYSYARFVADFDQFLAARLLSNSRSALHPQPAADHRFTPPPRFSRGSQNPKCSESSDAYSNDPEKSVAQPLDLRTRLRRKAMGYPRLFPLAQLAFHSTRWLLGVKTETYRQIVTSDTKAESTDSKT